jgi:hypothetical protein
MTKFLVSLTLVLSSTAAMAAFTTERLLDANKAALDAFKVGFPTMKVSDITGFKTWKSGDDAKVAIYMDMSGMPMETDYDCTDSGTQLDCQVTQ